MEFDYEAHVNRVRAGVITKEGALATLRHRYAMAGSLYGEPNDQQRHIRAVAEQIKALPSRDEDVKAYWTAVRETADRIMGA